MKKILFLILTGILLVSCSSYRRSGLNYTESYRNVGFIGTTSSNNYAGIEEPDLGRIILYSASIHLSVKSPDSTNAKFEGIAKKYGGYLSSSTNTSTTIRVKSENLNAAIDEISTLGKLESKSISGQDVTEEYTDYQIRLENAIKARDRYLELLAKAENVEATLLVEKELERLNETIELLKGKINRLDHLSDFSTITIYVIKKKKPGLLGYIGIGLYHSVKWLFVRN